MSQAYAGRKRIRRSFGRIPQVVEMPNLIEVHLNQIGHLHNLRNSSE